jgi:branched-chain amino acid aminotransferase
VAQGRADGPGATAGLHGLADERGVGFEAHHAPQHLGPALLGQPEAAGPADHLGQLPQVQRTAAGPVVLGRLGHHHRARGEVDPVADHVGDAEDVELAVKEPLDLRPTGAGRQGAVEHTGAESGGGAHVATEGQHGPTREGHHQRTGGHGGHVDGSTPGERHQALMATDLEHRAVGPSEEVLGVGRPHQADVAVGRPRQQPAPGPAPVGIVDPVDLVHHQHLSVEGGQLGGAAHDGGVGMDPLLAGHQTDPTGRQAGGQLLVAFPGQEAQGGRVGARAHLGQQGQGVVALAAVGGPEMGHDRGGLRPTPGEAQGEGRRLGHGPAPYGSLRRYPLDGRNLSWPAVGATWWVDGALVPAGAAVVAADDHGLIVGDGVFETLKVVDGRPFAVRRHLARLHRSAGGLGLEVPLDDDELRQALTATVAASGLASGRLRLTVTGGRAPLATGRAGARATVLIGVEPLPPRAATARVALAPWRRNEAAPTAGLKTTSYADNVIALTWAQARGADEALFANTAGRLCEGTGTNVFVVVDGEAVTPPLRSGCLAGVTRELVLEAGAAIEGDLSVDALSGAEEAFLTSSTRDVQPIAVVDGRPLPRVAGPVSVRAARALAALAACSIDP